MYGSVGCGTYMERLCRVQAGASVKTPEGTVVRRQFGSPGYADNFGPTIALYSPVEIVNIMLDTAFPL
jgi:hypothetical protein